MTLEEAIDKGLVAHTEYVIKNDLWGDLPGPFIAEAVRAWARQNVTQYHYRDYDGTPHSVSAVPLDKFGGGLWPQ